MITMNNREHKYNVPTCLKSTTIADSHGDKEADFEKDKVGGIYNCRVLCMKIQVTKDYNAIFIPFGFIECVVLQ